MDSRTGLVTARIVCVALLLGVLVYAGVALFGLPGGGPTVDASTGRILFWAWLATALAGGAGWYAAWRRARTTATSTKGRLAIQRGELGPANVVRLLILAWALLEAVALFGITVHVLTGRLAALAGGVGLHVFGTLLSYPREEWFTPFRRGDLPRGGT